LKKAFQEFYCFPGSPLPRGNDFSEFTAYFVQKAIPEAMAQIRNNFGSTPLTVQKFLLDLLRYNDNSNNPVCPPPPLPAEAASVANFIGV